MKEGAFCRFCVIFANRHPSCGTVGVFVVSPLKRFKAALEQCRSHQITNFHREAMEKSELFFNMIENRKNVMEMSNIALSKKFEGNRIILKTIAETIKLCGRQNFALRGHWDDGALNLEAENLPQQDNFRALLKYSVFSGNEMLRKHLEVIAAKNATMISKTTQEQLIRVCGIT